MGMFTWREGAPANRASRLEGLTHSPPLHATHPTGTKFERPLSTTSKLADQRNYFFFKLFQLPARVRACPPPKTRLLHWSLQIDCHSVRQITLTNGNYDSKGTRKGPIVLSLFTWILEFYIHRRSDYLTHEKQKIQCFQKGNKNPLQNNTNLWLETRPAVFVNYVARLRGAIFFWRDNFQSIPDDFSV